MLHTLNLKNILHNIWKKIEKLINFVVSRMKLCIRGEKYNSFTRKEFEFYTATAIVAFHFCGQHIHTHASGFHFLAVSQYNLLSIYCCLFQPFIFIHHFNVSALLLLRHSLAAWPFPFFFVFLSELCCILFRRLHFHNIVLCFVCVCVRACVYTAFMVSG